VSSEGLTARTVTVRQCAILVGGRATRLGALATATPKPLLPCGDRPFLAWLLRELCRWGVEEVMLLAGPRAAEMEASARTILPTLPRRLALAVATEPEGAGTAGALFHARDRLDERFLLLNGDSLLDGNLAALLADAARDDPATTAGRLALATVADTTRAGVVRCEGDRITAFDERPAAPGRPGDIHAGIAVLHRALFAELPAAGSLERDVLPRLAAAGALRATRVPGWFIDIGVPEDLACARAELPRRLHRPALFLDRDGVVNQDLGYVGSRERFRWTDGAREAIRAATDSLWHVFVVTNQSGIARGLYDDADVTALHEWLADEVRRAGGTIDDVRYCPHHPEAVRAAYRRACDCRKPAPGMLRALLAVWEVDASAAVMIGDQPTDLAAAAAAGMRGIRFDGGSLYDAVLAVVRRKHSAFAEHQDTHPQTDVRTITGL